jgi:TatD DNase family protein
LATLTDTHCHIYLPEFNADRSETLQRAFAAGVTRIFLPNVDQSTTPAMMQVAGDYPDNCFPLMGLHPTSVNENYQEELAHVEAMLDQHKFYGIGEIGIDLYWDKTFRDQQEEALKIQLGWASAKSLPVVIHVRNSHAETVEIITKAALTNLTGIFHCFSGTLDQAKEIIGLGFHLGIGGVSTFKNSGLDQVLREVFYFYPYNKLFMEIQNSSIEDIDFILDLYKSATAYQKERFISHWPEFEREMVVNEIVEKRQWKMIIDS